MAVQENLLFLEDRLNQLEKRVFGDEILPNDQKSCLDLITSVQNTLDNVSAGKERIKTIWSRLSELQESLDPFLADKRTTDDTTKAEIILSEEEQLKREVELLEAIQKNKEILDSEHIKAAPNFSSKLQPLTVINIEQKKKVDSLSSEVREVLESYNNIISLISKQFVQWDEILTRHEVETSQKK